LAVELKLFPELRNGVLWKMWFAGRMIPPFAPVSVRDGAHEDDPDYLAAQTLSSPPGMTGGEGEKPRQSDFF